MNRGIEILKQEQNYMDEMKKEQSEIREKVFRIIEQKIGGKFSGYISDNFGLIYDSFVLNDKDKWLNKLIEEYKSKKFLLKNFYKNFRIGGGFLLVMFLWNWSK